MPSRPFSLWRVTRTPSGRWLATSVGIPMPRFTYWPSSSSLAAMAAISSRVHMISYLRADPYGPLFDVFNRVDDAHHSLHEDPWCDDVLGVQVTVYHFFGFSDGHSAGRRDEGVEVACRHSVAEVTFAVCPVGTHQGDVCHNAAFQDATLAIEFGFGLALRDWRANASGSVE